MPGVRANFGKILLVFLLYLSHLLLSYGGLVFPLHALLGSALIGIVARAAWPAEWKDRLGLRIGTRDAILAIAMAPLLMALLYWMIRTIANAQNIFYQSPFAERGPFNLICLHSLGQTLNEEMLFGALLLFALQRKFNQSRPLLIAAIVAIGFSLLHYVFYRWIVLPKYSGTLTWGALFVLFAIGMLRNTLILKTGHIAYSWSVHLSINLVGLIGVYRFGNGEKLAEAEIFNLILGSQMAVILSVFILIACSISFYLLKSES